ncbi:MAG: hypothetical protein JXQ90_21695 [Cyclobacteriaceae bacterium]
MKTKDNLIDWNQAKQRLEDNIQRDFDLTSRTTYKIVVATPPYKCKNYENAIGYRIQVGKVSFINIPFEMLEKLFLSALSNNGIYENAIFKQLYPKQLSQKPCHVHSIGLLFEKAGVMTKRDSRKYSINEI